MKTARTIVFGIVGGIGSGKSFTSSEFVLQGAARFDADQEALKLYEDQSVLRKIRLKWANVFTEQGVLCKAELARLVFAPTEDGKRNLKFLNELLHPSLFIKFQSWLQEQKEKKQQFVVLDAPLLLEAGWGTAVDYLIYVEASRETRLRRVLARNWTLDELARREACQLPLVEKKRLANFIVDADKDDSHMHEQVKKILATCLER